MRHLLLLMFLILAGVVLAEDLLDPAEAPMPVRRAVFRAETAAGRGQLEDAARILTEALEAGESRDHPALRYRLGVYELELGKPQVALIHLTRASEQAPGEVVVWRDLARAAYESGAFAQAAEAFGRAGDENGEFQYYSGVAWVQADEPARAVTVLEPLVASAPDTVPQAWVQALVSAASTAGTPERASAGVDRLLRDHPDSSDSWRLASQQSQLVGRMEEASIRLQVADWLAGLATADVRRLAELQLAAGVPRSAARTYARLWKAGETDLAETLAVAWLQAHEPDSARVVLESGLAVEATASLEMLLGDLEFGEERWTSAAAAYGRAEALYPELGRAALMQGACAMRLGNSDEAAGHLRRAMADPAMAARARQWLSRLR